MRTIKIKKGLDLPIKGSPVPEVFDGPEITRVAVLGIDFPGLKPGLEVSAGDRVKLGQTLFTDKKNPSIRFTAPGAGRISAIHRGEKRALLSVVIDLEGNEEITFPIIAPDKLDSMGPDAVRERLLESGLWTAIRTRPFGKVPDPASSPHSIFITAMDTNPLAPSLDKVIPGLESDFSNGVKCLLKLTEGKVYICRSPGDPIPETGFERVETVQFSGPHPAGLASTHIHFLDPVHKHKTVWHIGLQDVIAFGKLFTSGKIWTERILSLAGTGVKNPRMIRTRLGASVTGLLNEDRMPGASRAVSGPVFSGHTAEGPLEFLGRFHQQVVVLPENKTRRFMGWLSPGWNLFSTKRILVSGFIPKRKFDLTTSLHGGLRTIVPSGQYEKVMPLDILATYLLRAIAVHDVDESEKLGCLELIEEDLGLSTFICPSKIDHMDNLRCTLNLIEKEG